MLETFDYDRGDLSAWQTVQQPSGAPSAFVDDPPGLLSDPWRPTGKVMHVQVKAGAQTWTGGNHWSSRTEVFGRAPTRNMFSTPANQWPDPVGTERWYGFDLYVPPGFATDPTQWLTFTQWKGANFGSPPIALEVKANSFRLGGSRTNSKTLKYTDLGPLPSGTWTRFVVGMFMSTSASNGWVEVWRDGQQALPRQAVATMDVYNGQPDPTYLKQGIYRDPSWTVDHELYFGPTTVATNRISAGG